MLEVDDEVVRLLDEATSDDREEIPNAIGADSFRRLLRSTSTPLPPVDFYEARDGLGIAYRHYPADSGRVFVLVHGSAGHSGYMHALASDLAGRGVARVYVPDMRGHGLSGVRRGDSVTYPEQMADDLIDLIAQIGQHVPSARIVVGGHSAGGGLVLRLCAAAATEIAAFVLLAPFLGPESPTTRPLVGGWVKVYSRRIAALTALSGRGVFGFNHLPVIEFAQPRDTRDGRETLSWSYTTMLAFGPRNGDSDLAAVGCDRPLLVVAGSGDECFVAEEYQQVVGQAAPHAEVRLVDAVGHWDILVDRPAADIIASWLTASV